MIRRLLQTDSNTYLNLQTMYWGTKWQFWDNKLLLTWKQHWWKSLRHGKYKTKSELLKVLPSWTEECSSQADTHQCTYFLISRSLQFQTFGHLIQTPGCQMRIGWQVRTLDTLLTQIKTSISMRSKAQNLSIDPKPQQGTQPYLQVQEKT